MTEPTTVFDARFSDEGTSATSWSDAERVLESAEIFWITTVRADGRPHVTPLVAVWLDGTLYFSTGAEEQKGVNLTGNPHVVLMTGRNDWNEGLDVMVEGDAIRATDEDLLHRLAQAWATKWDGSWQFDVRDGAFEHSTGTALVYGVRPSKVLAFGRGEFTHTSHRF